MSVTAIRKTRSPKPSKTLPDRSTAREARPGRLREAAAGYAFSPPGQDMRERLRDREDKFIRLKDRDGEIDSFGGSGAVEIRLTN